MSATLALAMLLGPQSVAAPTAVDIADATCVGALTMLSEQASATDKPGIDTAMMFFLGKIVGRSGAAAFRPAIAKAAEAMTPQAAPATAEKCAAQVEQATAAM